MTQEHWLLERLSSFGTADAFVSPAGSFTYAQLLTAVQAFRARLHTTGVAPGDSVALIADFSPEASAALLALILERTIVVPLSPAIAAANPGFLDTAGVSRVIDLRDGVAAAGAADLAISEHPAPGRHPLLSELAGRGEAGLILFSSGSTGESKASLLSFDRLLEKHQRAGKAWRTLAFLLLDHIGGINTLFAVLTSGGAVVSIRERSVDAVARAVAAHRVQLLPTTPTFLKMLLLAEAHLSYDLSSLECITYGTEPMPAITLEELHKALPEVRLKQTYGLSELGILRSQSRDPASLWVKVGGEGVETKVQDGILWIRSRSAMLGYLNAPSPFDAEGWFNTQDQVEVDGEYLRILGRTSEIINVGGLKVYPAEVENVLLQDENVRDVTVYGRKSPVTGQIVMAQVSLNRQEAPQEVEKRLRQRCREQLPEFQVPALIQIVDEVPVSQRFKKTRRAFATEPTKNRERDDEQQ